MLRPEKFTKAQLVEWYEQATDKANKASTRAYAAESELREYLAQDKDDKETTRADIWESIETPLTAYAQRETRFMLRLEFENSFGAFTDEALATVREVLEYLELGNLEDTLANLERPTA